MVLPAVVGPNKSSLVFFTTSGHTQVDFTFSSLFLTVDLTVFKVLISFATRWAFVYAKHLLIFAESFVFELPSTNKWLLF